MAKEIDIKKVLVTGATGSIGGEAIVKEYAKKMIILYMFTITQIKKKHKIF